MMAIVRRRLSNISQKPNALILTLASVPSVYQALTHGENTASWSSVFVVGVVGIAGDVGVNCHPWTSTAYPRSYYKPFSWSLRLARFLKPLAASIFRNRQ